MPDGEWFCPDCEDEPGAPVVVGSGKKPRKRPAARAGARAEQDDDAAAGTKRKASGQAKAAAGECHSPATRVYRSALTAFVFLRSSQAAKVTFFQAAYLLSNFL